MLFLEHMIELTHNNLELIDRMISIFTNAEVWRFFLLSFYKFIQIFSLVNFGIYIFFLTIVQLFNIFQIY